MNQWRVFVPGTPLAQSRPRFSRVGNGVRTYDKANVANYKAYFKTLVAQSRPVALFDEPLEVQVFITLQRPKSWAKKRLQADTKPDVDNLAKLSLDCLEGIVYTNDSRIVRLVVCKNLVERVGGTPGVEIIVRPITEV